MASVAAIQAQATRPTTEVLERDSLQLTRNLLRIAMSNISYIRGFFPENFYRKKFVPALEMKVHKLLPMDMESKRFIDWIEKGVFDALQKKYLRTLFLTICRGQDGPPIEEYTFSFKYAAEGSSENITSMAIVSSNGKPVHTNTKNQSTPSQMRQSACNMVRTLVQLMHSMDHVPKERTIFMRLHYYDDVTPENYEPPFFVSSTEEDPNTWDHEPLKTKVGNVDGRHYKLGIKVKSVLDPCDDGNGLAENGTSSDDLRFSSDDGLSTRSGAMVLNTPSSQLCSQLSQPCLPFQKVSPRMDTPRQALENKEQVRVPFEVSETTPPNTLKQMQSTPEAANNNDSDRIEHPLLETRSLRRGRRLRKLQQKLEEITAEAVDITNVSPQLSKVSVIGPACLDYQNKEGTRSNDAQPNCELKTSSFHTNANTNLISEAEKVSDDQVAGDIKQSLYKKALLYTLPREYITMKQLQEGLVDMKPVNIQKLMFQMCLDGYIENSPKVKWKGRQVFHTPVAEEKLRELRALFDTEMRENKEMKINKCDDSNSSQPWESLIPRKETCSIVPKRKRIMQSATLNESLCGRMQAVGSDITQKGLWVQQEPSSASKENSKANKTFQEPSLPRKATQLRGVQRRVAQKKKLIKGLEYDIDLLEETGSLEAENAAKSIAQLQKELDAKSEEVKRLRDRTATLESELNEKLEDSVVGAKASALPEQPNVTTSTFGFERKRVRFQDSDSPEEIDVDCAIHHFKTRKVDGLMDGGVHRSQSERAREKKLVSVAQKENHSSPTAYDPYDFDVVAGDKAPIKRKFGGSFSISSPKKRTKTNAACSNNRNSCYESDDQAKTLKSREKTRLSFLQRETVLTKCPRPKVYVRRARAAF